MPTLQAAMHMLRILREFVETRSWRLRPVTSLIGGNFDSLTPADPHCLSLPATHATCVTLLPW